MPENWNKYWESRNLTSRIYDFMRIYYFADIPIYHLGNIKNKSILEAGCGTSETLVRIAGKAKKVTGIDISRQSLLLSKKNFESHKIPRKKYSLVLGDIQNMNFKDGLFDVTFNTGVIEHFDDDEVNNKPVEEMIRVTKKGGKIVILVPSIYSPYYIYYLISRIPGLHKIYPCEPHRFYSIELMRDQLKKLNVKYKIKLCYRTLFLYLVAEITK